MFQEISPHSLDIQYKPREAAADDYVISAREDQLLLCEHKGELCLPTKDALSEHYPALNGDLRYLLSVDDVGFFLLSDALEETSSYAYHDSRALMTLQPSWVSFAAATALHLAHWYTTHVYCGRCGSRLQHSNTERALICSTCGHVEYPRISPVVIVAITHDDKILLTKHADGRYKRYALVAGFIEVGETAEDAAKREVHEEVGLSLKNLRYFKSQPWAFSQSLLIGLFAELEGSPSVQFNDGELSEATWFSREDIPADGNTLSLTWTMIEAFRAGKEPT